MQQGLSEPELSGDLVYKFRKIVGKTKFFGQFKKIIMRYKRIGYNVDVMRQFACLVVNPRRLTTILSSLIARRCVGVQTYDSPNIKLNIYLVGAGHLSVSWPIEVQL